MDDYDNPRQDNTNKICFIGFYIKTPFTIICFSAFWAHIEIRYDSSSNLSMRAKWGSNPWKDWAYILNS